MCVCVCVNIYIYIYESLWYIPETNTTLKISYTSLKKKIWNICKWGNWNLARGDFFDQESRSGPRFLNPKPVSFSQTYYRSSHPSSAYYTPHIFLNILYVLSHLILNIDWDRCYYPHQFASEETEAQIVVWLALGHPEQIWLPGSLTPEPAL